MSLENLVISESKEDISKTTGIITKQHGSHHERVAKEVTIGTSGRVTMAID